MKFFSKLLVALGTTEGISDTDYGVLLDYLAACKDFELIETINNRVTSCNGRRSII